MLHTNYIHCLMLIVRGINYRLIPKILKNLRQKQKWLRQRETTMGKETSKNSKESRTINLVDRASSNR
jgi:hypothetical protein